MNTNDKLAKIKAALRLMLELDAKPTPPMMPDNLHYGPFSEYFYNDRGELEAVKTARLIDGGKRWQITLKKPGQAPVVRILDVPPFR